MGTTAHLLFPIYLLPLFLFLFLTLHSSSALTLNWNPNFNPQLDDSTLHLFNTLSHLFKNHDGHGGIVDFSSPLTLQKVKAEAQLEDAIDEVPRQEVSSEGSLKLPGENEGRRDRSKGDGVVEDESRLLPGMLGTLSRAGLVYAKDVLVGQVLREVTPLRIPDLQFRESTPVGHATVRLFNITLSDAVVESSAIDLSATDGITIFASGVSANLTLRWHYKLSRLVHDHGTADIKVVGMQSGVRFALKAVNGTLSLGLLESGTWIDSLKISLHGGGGAWLYNLFAHAFSSKIKAAVETRVHEQIVTAVHKLDAFLQSLPREVAVDKTSAIDVTLVATPLVRTAFLTFGTLGQFVSVSDPLAFPDRPPQMPAGDLCNNTHKMVAISLSDFVLNSGAAVYYTAGMMRYYLTDLPKDLPFKLNTRSWKFLIPGLYRQYPNRPMALDFNATVAPSITFAPDGVHVDATIDVFICVLPEGDTQSLRVVRLSAEVQLELTVGVRGNNVTLETQFTDLQLTLMWTKVGRFPVSILQVIVRGVMKAVVIPLMNFDIRNGFPLPLLPGVELKDSEVRYAQDYLLVCTDISYTNAFI